MSSSLPLFSTSKITNKSAGLSISTKSLKIRKPENIGLEITVKIQNLTNKTNRLKK